jgi:hypothetical protein
MYQPEVCRPCDDTPGFAITMGRLNSELNFAVYPVHTQRQTGQRYSIYDQLQGARVSAANEFRKVVQSKRDCVTQAAERSVRADSKIRRGHAEITHLKVTHLNSVAPPRRYEQSARRDGDHECLAGARPEPTFALIKANYDSL